MIKDIFENNWEIQSITNNLFIVIIFLKGHLKKLFYYWTILINCIHFIYMSKNSPT